MPTTRRQARGRPRRRVIGLMVVCALGASAVAGCGGDDEQTGPEAPPAEETTTTSTTAPLSPEEEAKAVYLEFFELVNRLTTESPDPDNARLAELAVDPLLSDVQESLTTLASENHYWQEGDRSSHEIYGAEAEGPDVVILQACIVENDTLVDRDDGSTIESPPLMTRDLAVTVTKISQRWAVASIETLRALDGDVACI